MSRASEFQAEYGVIGAGALSKSLIGQLPRRSRQLGPVAGVSFRVASRMANSLRAGHAARNADELDGIPVILFHAPADQVHTVASLLEAARIDWKDKSLIFCDCEVPVALLEQFRSFGASTAVARQFGMAGSIMVEGVLPALGHVHRIASELRLRAIEITPGTSDLFAAAVTLATGALTPLVNRTAAFLRATGIRDKEAVRIAVTLFSQTVQEYGHSGKQSWAWHARKPDAAQMEAEITAVIEPFRRLFRELILCGFDDFEKHAAIASAVRDLPRGHYVRKDSVDHVARVGPGRVANER